MESMDFSENKIFQEDIHSFQEQNIFLEEIIVNVNFQIYKK